MASVQNIQPLEDGCDLRLTTCVFLRPSGKKLDRLHVKGHPDDVKRKITPARNVGTALRSPMALRLSMTYARTSTSL